MDEAAWIEEIVRDFVRDDPGNAMGAGSDEPAWGEPLVGFARGDDPLFDRYKEVIGEFHWAPQEAFALAFPDAPAEPSELTVISYVLPQTAATKADNRREMIYPSERWARTRIFGEAFNVRLRERLAATLTAAGYDAVAPMLRSEWRSLDSERFVFASTWSERHIAHAAGLGTFGLCDGLITPVGKAMRAGSVVARINVPPTPRPYTDHREYCLFYSQFTCGQCISRCPVGALSPAGHDKRKCAAHLNPTTAEYVVKRFGFDGYGCGLCQTGVPCESGIPARRRTEGAS